MYMFNAQDFYWFIGGDESQVYSSKRNTYVNPATDPDYLAWSNGVSAGRITNEEDIWYYVKEFQPWWLWDATAKKVSQPTATTYYKPQLKNYNSDKREREVSGGMTAAGIPVKTDDRSRGEINQSVVVARATPNFTTTWYGSDGNFYPVDAATMIAMADAVSKHTNDCFAVFAQIDGSITSGATTTLAQIDSAYAGL